MLMILIGALFTHLAPTAIILPSYFVLADVVLISQCVYYNSRNKRLSARLQQTQGAESEVSPLLRRSSTEDPATKISQDEARNTKVWVNNILSLVAVWIVGCVAWFISYKAGAWDAADPAPDTPEDVENAWEVVGLTLGYISAVCYLCARVPQIIKNYKEKSCEGKSLPRDTCPLFILILFLGLAVLFFMLSLTGNLTYGVSLVAFSQQKKYLLNALPFLLGSLGTIVEDCVIFVQFRLYSDSKRSRTVVDE